METMREVVGNQGRGGGNQESSVGGSGQKG